MRNLFCLFYSLCWDVSLWPAVTPIVLGFRFFRVATDIEDKLTDMQIEIDLLKEKMKKMEKEMKEMNYLLQQWRSSQTGSTNFWQYTYRSCRLLCSYELSREQKKNVWKSVSLIIGCLLDTCIYMFIGFDCCALFWKYTLLSKFLGGP